MGTEDQSPRLETSNIRLQYKTYIDQWSKSMLVDPDIVDNEYYTLANALQKLQAGVTDVPLEILRQLVPYRERQKVVYNYSNDEVEYLMSKSDPSMVREYDDIMQSFAREAEEIFRTRNIERVKDFMNRMLQLGASNNK